MGVPSLRGALYNHLVQEESLFGKIAVEEGFVTQNQLDAALRDTNGSTLTAVLVARGLLTSSQVQIIRDIQRIYMAEVSAPAESGGMLRMDRFLVPPSACHTHYLTHAAPAATKC